jgi:hypothetical protein
MNDLMLCVCKLIWNHLAYELASDIVFCTTEIRFFFFFFNHKKRVYIDVHKHTHNSHVGILVHLPVYFLK